MFNLRATIRHHVGAAKLQKNNKGCSGCSIALGQTSIIIALDSNSLKALSGILFTLREYSQQKYIKALWAKIVYRTGIKHRSIEKKQRYTEKRGQARR